MNFDTTIVTYLEADSLMPIPHSADTFLQRLNGPTWIHLKGKNRGRCRIVVTLLHGNEPSGFIALHRLLMENTVPETDIHCLVASVKAAQTPPLYSNRMLDGYRDLNRCFRPPFDDAQGELAKFILSRISKLAPEAIIDIHNTSGDGPSFGVSRFSNPAHINLTALFSHRLVITHIRLGALMEIASDNCKIVTVEVGGRQEQSSHECAYQGLKRFMTTKQLFNKPLSSEMFEILKHPVRLEIKDKYTLGYGSRHDAESDVTILENIESFNFGDTPEGTQLGWVGEYGLDSLSIKDPDNRELIDHYFKLENNVLLTRIPMKLFMATPDPKLAKGDCLFYLVPAERCG